MSTCSSSALKLGCFTRGGSTGREMMLRIVTRSVSPRNGWFPVVSL